MANGRPPSRLSYGALAAGIGGLLLILSLFLDWIGEGGFGANAFDLFSIVDFFLLIVGVLATGFAVVEAMGLQVNLPVDRTRTLAILGVIATSIVWAFLLESDHVKFGFILAAIGSAAILAGGILAERSPSLGVSNPAAGGGIGGGGGGAPAVGAPPAPAAPAPAAQPQVASQAPAGAGGGGAAPDWYPDPRGEKRLRYWDGSQWTDHTAD